MDGAFNSSEKTIRRYTDTFTTFLYAAAIHLIIGEFLRDTGTKTLANVGLLVFIIVFLLFDWLSRVRLPHLVKDDPQIWQQLSKAFLEVTGLVFLIFLAVLLVSSRQEDWQPYAAAFLFVSVLWNAVQLKVMADLDLKPLCKAITTGTVVDMNAVREYADKFLKYKEMVKTEFEKLNNVLKRASSTSAITRTATTASFSGVASLFWNSGWRTFAQYVGIHLGVANLFIAIVVAVHCWAGAPVFWPWAYAKIMHIGCAYDLVVLLVIVPVTWIAVNFFRLHHRPRRCWIAFGIGTVIVVAVVYEALGEQTQPLVRCVSLLSLLAVVPSIAFALSEFAERPGFRLLGAIVSYVGWLVLVFVAPVDTLLIVMACESIVVNAFLQIVTGSAKRVDVAPAESAA